MKYCREYVRRNILLIFIITYIYWKKKKTERENEREGENFKLKRRGEFNLAQIILTA